MLESFRNNGYIYKQTAVDENSVVCKSSEKMVDENSLVAQFSGVDYCT